MLSLFRSPVFPIFHLFIEAFSDFLEAGNYHSRSYSLVLEVILHFFKLP